MQPGDKGRQARPARRRKRGEVNEAIGRLVIGRLSMPDAVDLLAPKAKGDTRALRDEAMGIRSKLARLGELYVDDKINEADLISGREKGEKSAGRDRGAARRAGP